MFLHAEGGRICADGNMDREHELADYLMNMLFSLSIFYTFLTLFFAYQANKELRKTEALSDEEYSDLIETRFKEVKGVMEYLSCVSLGD